MKTGGSYWQASTPFEGPSEPLRPPSPEAQAGKGPPLPSSTFLATYDGGDGAFKVEEEQGRVRVVSQFKQGFGGRGAERYPSGETYVGDYCHAKRNGRGTFKDAEGGTMISHFKSGAPSGEGAKLTASGKLMRTHAGKEDGAIDHVEAAAIAANSMLPAPPTSWSPPPMRAPLPKRPPPPPTDYTTEAKALMSSVAATAAKPPTRDEFLAKLEVAEKKQASPPKNAALSLIPRMA